MSDDIEREAQRREGLHTREGDYRKPVGDLSGLDANIIGLRGEDQRAVAIKGLAPLQFL